MKKSKFLYHHGWWLWMISILVVVGIGISWIREVSFLEAIGESSVGTFIWFMGIFFLIILSGTGWVKLPCREDFTSLFLFFFIPPILSGFFLLVLGIDFPERDSFYILVLYAVQLIYGFLTIRNFHMKGGE